MSKNIPVLTAETRENTGKGSARTLRRDGKIPAIIYGGKGEEVKISTGLKDMYREFLRGSFCSKLVELDLGKEKIRAIPRDVQLDPVTDIPLHADFQRVDNDTKVNVFIRVNFLNADRSPGLKRGGVLSIVRREIELICRADSIPASLDLDLAKVAIGDSLHAHSISFPEGTEPAITDRDFTIATIVGRSMKTEEEEDEAAAVAAEAAAEAEAEEGVEGDENTDAKDESGSETPAK